MQTHFTAEQLVDAAMRESESILRKCVHCGFCLATCPTYTLLGDERDSPRGRIYLIKQMFEGAEAATEPVVTHIDRCLSCLSCMTTCPSGVDYMHLVDHARAHVAETYVRPWHQRALRALLAFVLPRPGLFRWALRGAALARPLRKLMPQQVHAMLKLAPATLPPRHDVTGTHAAQAPRRLRVALLAGCAQQVLDPAINAATIRLLNRLGVEVVVPPAAGCCGALVHHMGDVERARDQARRNVRAWSVLGDLDAVVINTSGCGTTVKDYGHLLHDDAELGPAAAAIAAKARDIAEVLAGLDLPLVDRGAKPVVAYHAACSLQHGQRVLDAPKALLRAAGFEVREPAEGHLCCGSAGTYNLLQPDLAGQLRERKVANLAATGAALVAAGNIGCLTQIGSGGLAVAHTVELLDWATGGPPPSALGPAALTSMA
jgi:glycolate oxidase iron-sulfur subunit